MKMDAEVSEDGLYRWTLLRQWRRQGKLLPVVILHPGPGMPQGNDRDIERCIEVAKRDGYAGIRVVSLYSHRAANLKDLFAAADPVGVKTNQAILETAKACSYHGRRRSVLCAWGARAEKRRVREVTNILRKLGYELLCLGTTQFGQPKHPLNVQADDRLVPWVATTA